MLAPVYVTRPGLTYANSSTVGCQQAAARRREAVQVTTVLQFTMNFR